MSRSTKIQPLLLSFLMVLVGCDDGHVSDVEFMRTLISEKKYYLKDCLVKLNFLWEPEVDQPTRDRVLREMLPLFMKEMVAGEFPYFSGYTTGALEYYVFYYYDKCENRQEYVQRLVEEKFLPNIPDFPQYEIVHEGIMPGFGGVTPKGHWLDY